MECTPRNEPAQIAFSEQERLEQRKLRDFSEVKLRQKICESSMELRELESLLRAAYVNKELRAQLAEKEAAKLKEKLQNQTSVEYMNTIYAHQVLLEKERKLEDFKRKYEYRRELEKQMHYAEQQKEAAFGELLRDKKLMEEAVQQINEENQRELEEKIKKMKKTKEELAVFHQARIVQKQKEQEAVEEENRQLLKYIEDKNTEKQKHLQELKYQEIQRAAIVNKIGRELHEIEKQKQEEEEARLLLDIEEQKLKAKQREKIELERDFRRRMAYQEAECLAKKERKKQLENEARQEELYKQQLLQIFAENDKLDQISAQKRRMKILEHRRIIEQMIEDQRRRREHEIQELNRLEALRAQEEQQRLQIIEQERRRLLKEHATKLLDYLPPGVLKKDDLLHLGSEFEEKYRCQEKL